MTAPIRLALIGSVQSSAATLEALIRHQLTVVGVLGLAPNASGGVSGYVDLSPIAEAASIPFHPFTSLEADDVVAAVRSWRPDLLFVVGLSQLVREPLLSLPTMGIVGFHPTQLPRGRGRAPLAWLTLDKEDGAASFFLMDAGVDSGPILVQRHFAVAPGAYAEDVERATVEAIIGALDSWLPALARGEFTPMPQDDAKATYNGRRTSNDGLLEWARPAGELATLVRAASRPHPGAFTFARGTRLIVWRASVMHDCRYRGVIGRVLNVTPAGPIVQTGSGVLRLEECEMAASDTPPLVVGTLLGYRPELEVHDLRQRVAALEAQLALPPAVLRPPA